MTITSADNPRIKAIARLKKARERRQSGRFLIEGEREVSRAIVAGITIDTLVICREYLGDGALPETTAEILEVGPAPMRRIAMREHPPGVVAVAVQFDTSLSHLEPGSEPLVLIAETVEKPGNLGAMLRTCDAAGADAFIVADPATDIFNPNVVRASQGALFSVPVAVATTGDVIEWCHRPLRCSPRRVSGGSGRHVANAGGRGNGDPGWCRRCRHIGSLGRRSSADAHPDGGSSRQPQRFGICGPPSLRGAQTPLELTATSWRRGSRPRPEHRSRRHPASAPSHHRRRSDTPRRGHSHPMPTQPQRGKSLSTHPRS